MQKIRVFLNQSASHGQTAQGWTEEIKRQLFRSQVDFVTPIDRTSFERAIDQAIQDHVDVVVSVGGDGTIHQLIQKLAGTPMSFLVIPAGTANDLATQLGIKNRIKAAIHHVREDQPHAIDLISINNRLMATNGGLGIASKVAQDINMLRNRIWGFKSLMKILDHQIYSLDLAVRMSLFPFQPQTFIIKFGQTEKIVKTPLLLINNQANIGGSFCVAPRTQNNDGSFNVSIFLHSDKLAFIKAVLAIRSGRSPDTDSQIDTFECQEIFIRQVDTRRPLRFFGDGELWPYATEWNVKILPKVLKVFCLNKPSVSEELGAAGLYNSNT